MKPALAYIHVSTARQGRSGLSLEPQQAAIARFCEAEGFAMVAERIEVETGKGADALDRRPELAVALADAKGRSLGRLCHPRLRRMRHASLARDARISLRRNPPGALPFGSPSPI